VIRLGIGDSPNGAHILAAMKLPIVCRITKKADKPLDQKLADLHLIACAPELLAMVKRFVSEAGNHNEDLADARALLAKVRG